MKATTLILCFAALAACSTQPASTTFAGRSPEATVTAAELYASIPSAVLNGTQEPAALERFGGLSFPEFYSRLLQGLSDQPLSIDGVVYPSPRSHLLNQKDRFATLGMNYPTLRSLWDELGISIKGMTLADYQTGLAHVAEMYNGTGPSSLALLGNPLQQPLTTYTGSSLSSSPSSDGGSIPGSPSSHSSSVSRTSSGSPARVGAPIRCSEDDEIWFKEGMQADAATLEAIDHQLAHNWPRALDDFADEEASGWGITSGLYGTPIFLGYLQDCWGHKTVMVDGRMVTN